MQVPLFLGIRHNKSRQYALGPVSVLLRSWPNVYKVIPGPPQQMKSWEFASLTVKCSWPKHATGNMLTARCSRKRQVTGRSAATLEAQKQPAAPSDVQRVAESCSICTLPCCDFHVSSDPSASNWAPTSDIIGEHMDGDAHMDAQNVSGMLDIIFDILEPLLTMQFHAVSPFKRSSHISMQRPKLRAGQLGGFPNTGSRAHYCKFYRSMAILVVLRSWTELLIFL